MSTVSKYKINFGKFKNTTYEDLCENQPDYVKWLIKERIFEKNENPKYIAINTKISKYLNDMVQPL